MLSSATSTHYLDEWRLVDAELNASSELDAAESRGGMPVGGRLSAAPKSGYAASGNKTSGRGPHDKAPPRCAGEGEAARATTGACY